MLYKTLALCIGSASALRMSGRPVSMVAGRGAGMGGIFQDVTYTIGNTPVVRVSDKLAPAGVEVYAKCEFFNPLASVKDRLALAIIEGAEKDGLTDSGYPRIVKEWKRGTDMKDAKLIFEGKQKDVSIGAYCDKWYFDDLSATTYHWVYSSTTFYTTDYYIRDTDAEKKTGEVSLVKLAIPEDVNATSYFSSMVVSLRKPWGDFASGTLLVGDFRKVLAASKAGRSSDEVRGLFSPIYTPTETTSLEGYTFTKNYVILNVVDSVKPDYIIDIITIINCIYVITTIELITTIIITTDCIAAGHLV